MVKREPKVVLDIETKKYPRVPRLKRLRRHPIVLADGRFAVFLQTKAWNNTLAGDDTRDVLDETPPVTIFFK
jgi:hypothetical protein